MHEDEIGSPDDDRKRGWLGTVGISGAVLLCAAATSIVGLIVGVVVAGTTQRCSMLCSYDFVDYAYPYFAGTAFLAVAGFVASIVDLFRGHTARGMTCLLASVAIVLAIPVIVILL